MKHLGLNILPVRVYHGLFVVLALLLLSVPARPAVVITDDWRTLFDLEKPTGKFDEPGLSGFEYLISSRVGEYRANDHYLIAGEESTPATSLVADLGAVGELSGTALDFSIQHNLVGGRNFTFNIDNPSTGTPSVLCWGDNCAAGSNSAQTIDGIAPITQYNGLQIQVRAQEVAGSSVMVSNLALSGIAISSGTLFDGIVTPLTPGTVPGDFGRVGQWLLGDDLEFISQEWELTGTVTLTRALALEDLTKVRLAVDFVNHLDLPLLQPIPLPVSAWLFASALIGLAGLKRRRR